MDEYKKAIKSLASGKKGQSNWGGWLILYWHYLHLFFHAWTIELSSTNPLWLYLSSTISQTNVLSSLEDLKTRSHLQGATRSTKLIQIELNQKDPKSIKKRETLSYAWMIVHIFYPFWFLELFGSLTSQSLLEYVGISHRLQVSDAQNEGFMVSFSSLLVFSRRCEHCNYHLQLSSTIMDMFDQNFLAIYCHLFMWDVCSFTRNIRIQDHGKAFCRVPDEVCPSGLRPWTVEADRLLCNSRLWEANGRKRCVEFDAVRLSTF